MMRHILGSCDSTLRAEAGQCLLPAFCAKSKTKLSKLRHLRDSRAAFTPLPNKSILRTARTGRHPSRTRSRRRLFAAQKTGDPFPKEPPVSMRAKGPRLRVNLCTVVAPRPGTIAEPAFHRVIPKKAQLSRFDPPNRSQFSDSRTLSINFMRFGANRSISKNSLRNRTPGMPDRQWVAVALSELSADDHSQCCHFVRSYFLRAKSHRKERGGRLAGRGAGGPPA